VRPGLTVLAQDPVGLGRAGAERLFARLGGDESPTSEVVLPVRLVERGSGEISA
jgi:LacI family transcriptional regulator